MRAAAIALPFEAPKLAVTAVTPLNEDFAARLDRAIARSEKAKLIDRGLRCRHSSEGSKKKRPVSV
jgi:hypothetical protein